MSEVTTNKYLNFEGLKKYDALIKEFIASGNTALADAIAALDKKIGSLDIEGSDDKSLAEIVEDIYSSIVEIVEKQGALDDKDAELEGKINGIVGDLESLGDGVNQMSLVEIANKLKAIEGSVSKNAQDIVGVTERVSALEETIKELGEIEGGENLGSIVNKVNNNAAAIETLKGEGEGSVKKIAADAATAAETAAKTYADGLVKDSEGNSLFDEAGAAAAAQAAAIADAESKYQLKGDYEAAGTAAALNDAMDERVKVLEAIDHDKLVADAVAEVVAGAESDFDTLKEVADWIASDKEGSAALQTTVSNHTESINTINSDLDTLEAKVEQDITNLTTHMSEAATALGEVDGRLDALEAFKDSHETITIAEIEDLFNTKTEE
jgi:ABC-type transporter Mla subunit MlaD